MHKANEHSSEYRLGYQVGYNAGRITGYNRAKKEIVPVKNEAYWILKGVDWYCSNCGTRHNQTYDDYCCKCGCEMNADEAECEELTYGNSEGSS